MVGLHEVDAGHLGAWESTQADEMGNQRYDMIILESVFWNHFGRSQRNLLWLN